MEWIEIEEKEKQTNKPNLYEKTDNSSGAIILL